MLTPQNKAHGFYGTIVAAYPAEADQAWEEAFNVLLGVGGNTPPEAIRYLLDSAHGRYFAHTVLEKWATEPAPVIAAVRQWLHWKLNSQTAASLGIPGYFVGSDLLKALLAWAEVNEEADPD